MSSLAGSIGRVGVWGHLDSLPVGDLRAYAARVAELGYAALWVPETVGREPFVSLALLAGSSGSMWLGTSIANIYARDAATTRTAAMALHEATGGRFVLGLGVSHPHLVTKLRGHPYERPVTRMQDYLADVERLPYKGPTIGDSRPPIVLAALRERMARLAATNADGAFPYLVTVERVRWMRGVLDDAADGGRPFLAVTLPVAPQTDRGQARTASRTYLTPYLRTPNYQASFAQQGFDEADWAQPGSDRLVEAMVAWGPSSSVEERIRALQKAGADHVALIPLAPDGATEEHLPTLEALARSVPSDLR
jgi:probable F420-dependent oxidoreductase